MSYHYQITKYNPQNRDDQGRYLLDEWISYSDIGKYPDIMTFDKYFEVETKYIDAIVQFMACNKIHCLDVSYIEKRGKLPEDVNNSKVMQEVYDEVKLGYSLSGVRLDALCRLILRDYIWCKLKNNKNMEVHFGDDYYMFIISNNICSTTLAKIEGNGLFVEKFKSPYFMNDDFVNSLNIFDGQIICNEFDIDEGLEFQDQSESFRKELLTIEFNNKSFIDVGWDPEMDPSGEFVVRVTQNPDCQKSMRTIRCSSLSNLKETIELLASAIATQH